MAYWEDPKPKQPTLEQIQVRHLEILFLLFTMKMNFLLIVLSIIVIDLSILLYYLQSFCHYEASLLKSGKQF